MKTPDTCFTCGSPLPAGGSCPACLLKSGMEAETVPFAGEEFPDGIDDHEVRTTTAPRILARMIATSRAW